MKDWTRSLRPASFRGARFLTETEELSAGGRNVATHEFVRSEDVLSEDMGRKAKKYKVKAYIANDAAEADSAALVSACTAPGAGSLVLPLQGTVQVICTEISSSHAKEKLGYVEFSLEFVEAEDGPAFPSISLGDRLAIEALDGLAALAAPVVDRARAGLVR